MAKQFQNVSPLGIFLMYIAAAFAGICAYQFFSPAQSMVIEILGVFKFPWRFSNAVIMFIDLFPALAFSALVIPFGLKEHSEGGYAGVTFVGKKGFSSDFLKYLFWPVITACLSAITYSLLFFLALPITTNFHNSIQDKSELFARAKQKAEEKAASREWAEAAQFIDICDRIWPENDEITRLKGRLVDSLASYRQSLRVIAEEAEELQPVWGGIPGDPVNASDALRLSEDAYGAERYYDAHWLAALAERLAAVGSVEESTARAQASRAWEKIQGQEPNAQERERYSLYMMKREAYEAMNYGNWVNAFYSFQELSALTPNDPDVAKYLEACRAGVARMAFFIDELDMSIGTTLGVCAFSLPGPDGGRLIVRFNSLALLQDNAYAWGAEALSADSGGRLRYRVSSEYGKLIPVAGRDFDGNPNDNTVLLFQALDRADKTKGSGPVWINDGGISGIEYGANQILLPVSYDNFLLLSRVKQGKETLSFRELFAAEKTFENYGYLKESFSSEILRRLGNAVLFLPMAVLALVLGWRYRARKKPRYVYVPMIFLLPAVFNLAVHFYRNIIDNLSIWLSLSMVLSTALICLCAGAFILFILCLILLAAQHG